jgi:hypothetical protein
MWTKEERNKWQRDHRKKNRNSDTLKYEKTKKGFLMRKYRNMQSRVLGIQKKKKHLYEGLGLLDRKDFYEWAFNHPYFESLFKVWKDSGYDRKLCPTVDRIDSFRGYHLENMRWLTHSENSRLGNISRFGSSTKL